MGSSINLIGLCILFCLMLQAISTTASPTSTKASRKTKRQIFREQVLPAIGGKIPDSAFRADRLNLNRFNKDGYAITDGVVFDQRRLQRHPYQYQKQPEETLKVFLTENGRFVSVYGRSCNLHPDAIETTYIIRSPVKLKNDRLTFLFSHLQPAHKKIYTPIVSHLVLPNNAIFVNPTKTDYNSQDANRATNSIQRSDNFLKSRYQNFDQNPMEHTTEHFGTKMFTPIMYGKMNGFIGDTKPTTPRYPKFSRANKENKH